jgi:hypothetical protein
MIRLQLFYAFVAHVATIVSYIVMRMIIITSQIVTALVAIVMIRATLEYFVTIVLNKRVLLLLESDVIILFVDHIMSGLEQLLAWRCYESG